MTTLQVNKDGTMIIFGDSGGNIKIWDLKSQKEKFTLNGHSESVTAIALPENGQYIVSGSEITLLNFGISKL